MTAGTRYRIVVTQNGKEHVGGVVIGDGEIQDQLEIEATLHEGTGWDVQRVRDHSGLQVVYASKGETHRSIAVRSFTPHDDRLSA